MRPWAGTPVMKSAVSPNDPYLVQLLGFHVELSILEHHSSKYSSVIFCLTRATFDFRFHISRTTLIKSWTWHSWIISVERDHIFRHSTNLRQKWSNCVPNQTLAREKLRNLVSLSGLTGPSAPREQEIRSVKSFPRMKCSKISSHIIFPKVFCEIVVVFHKSVSFLCCKTSCINNYIDFMMIVFIRDHLNAQSLIT